MHLSVARRHGLSLPSQLPSSLKNSTRHILKSAEENSHAATILSSGDNTHQPEVRCISTIVSANYKQFKMDEKDIIVKYRLEKSNDQDNHLY
jgi:hypothetical protein